MPGGNEEVDTPENEWTEDREVFAVEEFEKDGKKGKRIYVSEAAKVRWRKNKGNPRKFTPERAMEMLNYFAVGGLKQDVCEAVGIDRGSLVNWEEKARDTEKSTEELRAFVEWMGRKRALRRIEALARIQRAGMEGTWTAEAWYLERSDPNNWRQRNSVIPENADGTPYSPATAPAKTSEEMIRSAEALAKEMLAAEQKSSTGAAGDGPSSPSNT
jgi:hypothetical protein